MLIYICSFPFSTMINQNIILHVHIFVLIGLGSLCEVLNGIVCCVELSFFENGWMRSMCNEWIQLLI